MNRVLLIGCIIVLISPITYSKSDKEILETVRANATAIFLEQASRTLPESFHKSGLAPSDRESLIKQLAEASGACLADALVEYAKTTDTPLSEMVNDEGVFGLTGDGSSAEFNLFLESCIERAWAAVGASYSYD